MSHGEDKIFLDGKPYKDDAVKICAPLALDKRSQYDVAANLGAIVNSSEAVANGYMDAASFSERLRRA